MRSRNQKKNILEAFNSLSESSLRVDQNGPSAEVTSDGENTILVQPASQGLDSDQENTDLKESFIGAQPNLHDKDALTYKQSFVKKYPNKDETLFFRREIEMFP